MKLSELIAFVGDDNVEFQNLGANIVNAVATKDRGDKITFMGPPGHGIDAALGASSGIKSKYVGLVVWLPREKLPQEFQ